MLREKTNRILNSNGILVFIVFLALFLDNMLLTTVVPILPNFLIEESLKLKKTNATPEFNFLNVYDKAFYNKFQINNTKNESKKMAEAYKQEIQNTHESVGWVFSSKAVFQLLFNPFLGKIITRVGYSIPMFLGFIILFISTLVFAFAKNYYLLVFARSMQGIGSAFTAVSGLGKLAHVYDDDKKRGNMMSLAMSGLALGVLIGPPYGGILYQFVGKSLPFVILAILALFDGTLQVMALKLEVKPEPMENKISSLICDPYILITAGAISFANLGIASLEPTLPLWMLDTMNSEKWEQGMAFLPASISYLLGTNIFGPLAYRLGRWLSGFIGMILISVSLFMIPFAARPMHLILPNFTLGFAIGMVDSSLLPHMAYLVDLRHKSVYASVYAIADIGFCLGFAVGPALGGSVVKNYGFERWITIIAVLTLLYAPILLFLKNVPAKNDDTLPLNRSTNETIRYSKLENEKQDEIQN